MKKQEILEIAKELIIISVKYKKNNKSDKSKLLEIFNNYEKQLSKDNTKYSKTILSFVVDLKNDLESGNELNIDILNTDEYLENYLLTKNELKIYNNLILEDTYREIFNELINNGKNNIISKSLDKLNKNYIKNIKLLNTKIIAQNLLIFTSFDRIINKKYLINLYKFLKSTNDKKLVLEMIKLGDQKILEVKNYGIKFYKTDKINYKYIGFKNIDGKTVLSEKIVDCSKFNERTGNYKYEYRNIIKSL